MKITVQSPWKQRKGSARCTWMADPMFSRAGCQSTTCSHRAACQNVQRSWSVVRFRNSSKSAHGRRCGAHGSLEAHPRAINHAWALPPMISRSMDMTPGHTLGARETPDCISITDMQDQGMAVRCSRRWLRSPPGWSHGGVCSGQIQLGLAASFPGRMGAVKPALSG